MRYAICKVTVLWVPGMQEPAKHLVTCTLCERPLGRFSQHESAMNWAQAHARCKRHVK